MPTLHDHLQSLESRLGYRLSIIQEIREAGGIEQYLAETLRIEGAVREINKLKEEECTTAPQP